MLYIAYGSNLCINKMKKRCPNAKPIFYLNGIIPNKLFDWKLVFNKYANIKFNRGSVLQIGLWKLTTKCKKSLDLYEDYPNLKVLRVILLFLFHSVFLANKVEMDFFLF